MACPHVNVLPPQIVASYPSVLVKSRTPGYYCLRMRVIRNYENIDIIITTFSIK